MRKLSLVLFLVACGDDGVRHTPDAAPHPSDGSPDSPADAVVAPVTVAAVRDGQPVSGVHVYFQNADSTVVLATTTDATGTASAVMAAGGYVTAVNPFTLALQQDELDTFVGVKPGDHLVLARSFATTTMQVTVLAPDDTAMTNFVAYSPCNNFGTPLYPPPQSLVATPVSAQVTLDNCGTSSDFVVLASNGSAAEFLYAPAQAIADQGTVDLTASTYAAAGSRKIAYTDVPALRSMQQQADLVGPSGPILEFQTETPSDTPSPSFTYNVPLLAGAIDVVQTYYNFHNYSDQMTVDWGDLGSGATIDVGSRALSEFTGPPMFDPSTHQASDPVDASVGLTADFSIFALSASRQAAARSWTWYVAAPYGATVAVPTVPTGTDMFDYNIGSGDTYNVDSWVNGKVPGGYDAVRALVLSALPYLDNNGAKPQDLVLGGSGTASFIESESAAALLRSGKPSVLRHRTR